MPARPFTHQEPVGQTLWCAMNDHVTTVSSTCPACGTCGENTTRDVRDHEYALPRVTAYAACVRCGTCFQTPMPDEEQLASFYPLDYHSMASGGLLTRMRHDVRLRGLLGLLGDRQGRCSIMGAATARSCCMRPNVCRLANSSAMNSIATAGSITSRANGSPSCAVRFPICSTCFRHARWSA